MARPSSGLKSSQPSEIKSMASISLIGVTKRYRTKTAVEDLTFEVADGEFFCLLGPAGAGKTTTLRVIAGLTEPSSGDVLIDGVSVKGVHPSQRDLAMIFDNLALYPNRTGFGNIAFPLRVAKVPDLVIKEKVGRVAATLGIEHVLGRLPGTYSGGERQRVALARALVREPRAFLLDEPLSSLDALLRVMMRAELKRLQRELGRTMLMATPDFVEAVALATRIAVIRDGRLQQMGSFDDIYSRPSNLFVGSFVGQPPMNVLLAHVRDVDEGRALFLPELPEPLAYVEGVAPGKVQIGLRPEAIRAGDGPWQARVAADELQGGNVVLDLEFAGSMLRALTPVAAWPRVGSMISVGWDVREFHLFEAETGQRLGHARAVVPSSMVVTN
jgi:multiple sugar transport system ATP-binding protein